MGFTSPKAKQNAARRRADEVAALQAQMAAQVAALQTQLAAQAAQLAEANRLQAELEAQKKAVEEKAAEEKAAQAAAAQAEVDRLKAELDAEAAKAKTAENILSTMRSARDRADFEEEQEEQEEQESDDEDEEAEQADDEQADDEQADDEQADDEQADVIGAQRHVLQLQVENTEDRLVLKELFDAIRKETAHAEEVTVATAEAMEDGQPKTAAFTSTVNAWGKWVKLARDAATKFMRLSFNADFSSDGNKAVRAVGGSTINSAVDCMKFADRMVVFHASMSKNWTKAEQWTPTWDKYATKLVIKDNELSHMRKHPKACTKKARMKAEKDVVIILDLLFAMRTIQCRYLDDDELLKLTVTGFPEGKTFTRVVDGLYATIKLRKEEAKERADQEVVKRAAAYVSDSDEEPPKKVAKTAASGSRVKRTAYVKTFGPSEAPQKRLRDENQAPENQGGAYSSKALKRPRGDGGWARNTDSEDSE